MRKKIRKNGLYYFDDAQLYVYDIDRKKHTPIPLEKKPSQPIDIAFDSFGNLYVADIGQDMQVKKYSEKGSGWGSCDQNERKRFEGVYTSRHTSEMPKHRWLNNGKY